METSCGILMKDKLTGKYLFVKGGGPYFKNKQRSYGIPKGGINPGETYEECARREFFEETGIEPTGKLTLVYDNDANASSRKKHLVIFLMEGVEYPGKITSNTCEMEYRGQMITIPEVCNPKLLTIEEAKDIIYTSQYPLLETIESLESKK